MLNFNESPFLVIWEVTQACDLACVHCRASAQPNRNPQELSTIEGYSLLEQIRECGDPLVVFTGGDPLKRPDLFRLLRHSVQLKLRTTVTPSATPLLTGEAIEHFQDCGVSRMAVSLDGPTMRIHDDFRRVAGSYERTLFALRTAREIGLETQVNTTVTRYNKNHLTEIAELVAKYGSKLWSVFFLVPTGRGMADDDLTAEEYEKVFGFLYDLSKIAPFDIKTTEAQHYRRYVAQQRKAEGAAHQTAARGPLQRVAGINDGKGFVFISHTGDIFPSGFLPLQGGNIRHDRLIDVYRNAPLFQALRKPQEFHGKCGYCEYRNLCGGSRSRVYALEGDPFGSDPRCIYQPHSKPASEQLVHIM